MASVGFQVDLNQSVRDSWEGVALRECQGSVGGATVGDEMES